MKLKEGVIADDFTRLHPDLYQVIGWVKNYSEERGLSFVITSLISDREGVKSISTTHADGRAFDIRIRDWPEAEIEKIQSRLVQVYGHIGAISRETGRATIIKRKSTHLHIQVRPTYP